MKKGWSIESIGNISLVIAGQSPEGKFYNNKGNGLPFHQGKKEFGNKYLGKAKIWTEKNTKIAEPFDILMSVRAPVGIINITLEKICIGRGLAAIRPFDKIADKYFIYYYLLSKEREIIGKEGAVFPSISKKEIEEISILLPPLPTQQRIVKILDTTFAKIDTIKQNAERNLQNAKELFQSLLKKELNGKNKWPVTKIIEVCTLKSGNSLSQTLFSEKGEIPYIKVAEMNLVENIPQITSSPYMVKRKNVLKAIFPKGSIIFPKRGGAIATNKKRITNVEICADLNIMGIIPNNTIKSEYLYYYFLNVDLGKLSNGTTIPQINNGDIAPLKIFLPPLSEQEQIVTKLDSLSEKCKELENNYRQTITDCDEMKKSILAKAFNGEL